jgi:hypothetical protein
VTEQDYWKKEENKKEKKNHLKIDAILAKML